MKAIDAMEFLDDDLICNAEEYMPHKKPLPLCRYGAAAAACICAAGGAAVLSRSVSAPEAVQPSDGVVLPDSSAPVSKPVSESTPKESANIVFNDVNQEDMTTSNFFCIYYDEEKSPKMSRDEMLGYFGTRLPQTLATDNGEWRELREDPDMPYVFLCCIGEVLEQYDFRYDNAKNGSSARIAVLKRDGSPATRMIETLPRHTEKTETKLIPSKVCGVETTVTTLGYTDDLGGHESISALFKTDTCVFSLKCDDLSRGEFTELLESLVSAVTGNEKTSDNNVSFTETSPDDYLIY